MVKRKQSRVASRSKPIKPPALKMEHDEFEEENRLKRLDDFDMKVQEICKKMELEKKAVIDSVRHLYFIDEQRTSADINNMLWLDYLSQNSATEPSSRFTIRESIAEIIEKSTVKKGRKKQCVMQTNNTLVPSTRNTCKKPQIVIMEETPAISSSRKSKRGQKLDVQYTPVNQNFAFHGSNFLITPKFDPRTPLLTNTLRKPKFGEIAVSLKGSPLQLGIRDCQMDYTKLDNLDDKAKEELETLYRKLDLLLRK